MTIWNRRAGLQVLIVEDSTTQAAQLAAILEDHGYNVVVAGDGEQALDFIREQQPALVISDVVMPKLDGYGLCAAIKGNLATKNIPIILVTTLSDPSDVLRGLECGADNFIRKPFDERYLLSRIDYLLMNRELRAHQKTQIGLEIDLRGQRYFINSDRQQILDLLISTYEQAVDLNKELSQRESELAKSNEVLDNLYQIADDLNRAVSEREVLESVLERVMDLPDVYAAWISLTDKKGGPLKIAAVRNLPFVPGEEHDATTCQCHTGTSNGGAAFNVQDCRRLQNLSDHPELSCHAIVPLSLSGGRRTGVMNVVAPDELGFDDSQLQLLMGIGNQLSVALERAELHENLEDLVEQRTKQVKRLNRLYSVLSGINNTIVRARTQSELFEEVCRIAVEEGGFVFAWIGTVDADGRNLANLAFASGGGKTPDASRAAQAVAEIEAAGVLSEVAKSGLPLIRNHITAGSQVTDLWTHDFKSLAVLPLRSEASTVGICLLYAAEPDAFDDQEEMGLLVEIAGDIGFALDYQEKDRRLTYLAYYDSVTGLPNRILFADRLNQALHEASRHHKSVGLAILDIDRFKTINDSLGHAIGDAFLKAVGERLEAMASDGDTVARIAGDEFGVMFADMQHEKDAGHIVTKILDCFTQPFKVASHELFVSASLGIAVYPHDGETADKLLQNGDVAMNRAKAAGGIGYQFYSEDMTVKARERLALENDLRRALERKEFILHYQPIVDATTGQITGVEALVRWLSPERGLVPPFSFISIAEETSLIIDIGAWVMEEACRQVATGWGERAAALRLSVNVSTRQFLQGNFLDMVTGVLKRTGIDPGRLSLEVTESHLMENVDDMVAIMQQLGELGVKFSIDDFGTGYSSLAYLKNLPIANLKIDRSFVKNLPASAGDAAIVKTIISMAHSLNQHVIAEGVETREQLEFLQVNECGSIQGYYFSKPVPAADLALLLARDNLRQP